MLGSTILLAAIAFTVTAGRKLVETETNNLTEERSHPNSVYSLMDMHTSTKEKIRTKSKYKAGKEGVKIFYQTGESETDLPVCSPFSVCSKLDTYGEPFLEKQCRCPGAPCSDSMHTKDGHTIHDRTKQFKICEPVKKLKRCKYFRDITWTNIMYPDNSTAQVMHCRCPRNSVAYLVKRQAYQTDSGLGYQFSFACSPQTKLKCERKEPCRLFSVKKSAHRADVDEVTTSSLCSCPHNHRCPQHHLDVGVVPGRVYSEDAVRAYSGYCM